MSTSPVSVSWATAGISPWPSHFSSVVMATNPGSRLEPHGDTLIAEIGLGLAYGVAAEALRRLADQLGALEGCRVEGDLVRARAQQRPDVLDAPHAAAHGERHVDALGRPADHIEHDLPLLVGGGDVEEDQLVGALRVVGARGLHGIARVTEIHEAHALDHAARVDVEARNEALAEHGASGPPPPRRGDPPPRCRARAQR